MPIIMTNAGPVNVADGTPPEVIAKIRAANSKPAKAAAPSGRVTTTPAKIDADEADVQRRVNEQRAQNRNGLLGEGGAGALRKAAQGFTFNFMDNIIGGAHALGKIGQGREAMAREYRNASEAERRLAQQQAGGTGGTIAEIAGALANPIADGVNILKFGGKAVPWLAKAATKLEKAPSVVRGISAGANQGALNAAGSADHGDRLTAAGQGYLAGGLTGGVFAGAGVGARRGVQILKDRSAKSAERVAYGKIGQYLDKAEKSPQWAERELAVTKARGGDPMVMDLTPGLRAHAMNLSRRPEIPTSNKMIERGEERLLDRHNRFDTELKNRVGNADADAHLAGIHGARKGHGNVDYQTALDGKFHWSPELQKFMDEGPAELHRAFRDGAHLASLHGQDIGQLGMKINPVTNAIEMHTTPSMRVFDYAKRALDQRITQAYKAGKDAYAGGLSNVLRTLKQHISDANPDYAPALAKQKDFFERADALQFGTSVMDRMKTEPRKVLKELQALDPSKHADAREGIIDAMIATRTQKADPIAHFMSILRSPEQRKVMEFVFNGKGNLGRFERFAKRELRGTQADMVTAPGRQSITSHVKGTNESLGEDMSDLATGAFRGFGFGGPTGAAGNLLNKFNDLKNGLSPHALDAMAKALMSDGKGLTGKVTQARAYAAARKAKNAKAAIRLAKGGQQQVTDQATGE